MQAQAIISETYLVFEIWFTVAAVYLMMNLLLSVAVAGMEKRLRVYR
jgi:polar amino acid transport system permease protein